MANLLFDGFELGGGGTVDLVARRWTGGALAYSSGNGRLAGHASASSGNTSATTTRLLNATPGHVFFGVAYQTTTARTSTACNWVLYDGATAQIGWRANSDGSISVYRGSTSAATLIGTTAAGLYFIGSFIAANFKMVELEVVFATGATGSVKLRVNDTEVLNVASVQTANSGAAQCDRVTFQGTNTGGIAERYDDLYLNDDTGGAPHNTYYGEAFVVEQQIPNAAGNYTEWTRNTGANNFVAVDDYATDDTDYVASGTANQRDTYGSADLLTSSGTVVGVEHQMWARKDDVAARGIKPMFRTGGADFLGAEVLLGGSYAINLERFLTNPNTTVAWTISDINGLEHGVKLST